MKAKLITLFKKAWFQIEKQNVSKKTVVIPRGGRKTVIEKIIARARPKMRDPGKILLSHLF